MITLNDLHISFDSKPVIAGVSIDIPRETSLVVLGKNGSGKSVLLKAIAGLIGSTQGTITINERDSKDFYCQRDAVKTHTSGMVTLAYVFQKGGLFDSMNVFDNVAFGLRRGGCSEDDIAVKVHGALGRVGLEGSEAKYPSFLSGGMQKRVGIARAICVDPQIILYDDPTAGLDPILSDAMADLILEIKQSSHATSVIVTQDLALAHKVADTIALLYNGVFVFYGSNAEFFSASNPYTRQFINGTPEGPIDMY